MNIKGFEEWRKHIEDVNTVSGRARIASIALIVFTLTTLYFILSDQIPTWTIDSEILVTAIGLLIFSLFFSSRKQYLAAFKDQAYRNAFIKFGVPGLAIVFAAIAHIAYMNGPKWPVGKITLGMNILGWYWIIVGVILWLRAVTTFGIDNLTMMYVYFPDQSRVVNSSIYSILRHPIYASGLRIGFGLALLNTGIYPLCFMPFLLLAFTSWIRLVEEKELLERFPDYATYRKQVPAFWTKPTDIGRFWSFLLNGK